MSRREAHRGVPGGRPPGPTLPELPGAAPLGGLALARGTVDRVTKRRTDKDWIDAAWKDPRTRVLVVREGQALVRDDGLVFVSPEEAPAGTRFLLGEDADGVVYFGVSGPLPAGGDGVRVASLREVEAWARKWRDELKP